MSSTYYSYETIQAVPNFPPWSNTWPGYNGCPNRTLSYGVTGVNQPPAPGSPKSYDPVVVRLSRNGEQFSGRTYSIPPYRFTNYQVYHITTRQHLIKRVRGQRGINRFYQFGIVDKIGGVCTPQVIRQTSTGPVWSTYNVVSRDFPGLATYVRSELNEGEVTTALNEVRNEVIADAMTAYDVLTDIAESRDIPRMLTSIANDLLKILRTLKSRFGKDAMRAAKSISPLDLLRNPNKLLRKFGDQWMTYRYGVMPLVYSYRDAMKNLRRGTEVKSSKMRVVRASETGQSLPPLTTQFWAQDVEGSVSVRGHVFQHFLSDELARTAGLGFNPLVTAWELIPYSFVIDWFVDVGKYIAARTNQNWAQRSWACLSRRDTYTKKTWLHLPNEDQSIIIDNVYPFNWWGSLPPSTPNQVMSNPEGYFIFNEEEVDSYSRWTVPLSGASVSFSPSLNWRRLVDASVMSLNQLSRFMRFIR